jgi:SpoVK/Ycf46/Vps4 family AAA+-type ATPase
LIFLTSSKTQTVRHLFSRLPAFRHFVLAVPVEGRGAGAGSLLEAMLGHVADSSDPAVVVIEDIDRLFETKVLTPQFFFNVLDGLFQPVQPVLWIATSNDPRRLEANLLDRPGRFDRVFVFPLPGPDERRRLRERYAAWPLDTEVVAALARESDGLTGAHLREVCYAAALDAAEEPAQFAAALRDQLGKVQAQHQRARSYDFELKGLKVGFGA